MKIRHRLGKRWFWLLWIALVGLWVAVVLYSQSTRLTRTGGAALLIIIWCGLIALCWRSRALRFALLGATILAAGFLAWPARALPAGAELRADYLTALRRYEGVEYVWGGESPRGIDCSGLIRRGLIDAQFLRGLRTAHPALVRQALALWWTDCTARALGECQNNITTLLLETPSLNQLDHSQLLPGDLAVTRNGVHILAYLGENSWIEADPSVHRVVTVTAPTKESAWFQEPMKIVRWKALAP